MVVTLFTAASSVVSAGSSIPVGVATSNVAATTLATTTANTALASASGSAAFSSITALASSPWGWIILGAEAQPWKKHFSFDCWKSVVHDESKQPSNGKLLRDIIQDSRIKQVTLIDNDNYADQPIIILANIWDEEFQIEYIQLPDNSIGAHAVKLNH